MKFLKSLALIMGLLLVAYFAGATVYNIVYDSNRDGTAEFSVDSDGNIVNTGSITASGAISGTTITGTIGTLTSSTYGVKVSTSATSTTSVYLAGAVVTLPSSGYSEGAIIFNKTDHRFYWASAAVTDISCWSLL